MSTGLPGVIPFSLQDTLQGMNGLTMMQALQQRQQEELARRAEEAEKAAAAAQQGYQQAAAAPPPQLPMADVFAPTLLGNIASVIAQDPKFSERAQQGIQGRRAELIKARSDNLQALRDVYSQRADEAQRAGDLETTEKYRRQFELASKTIDVLEREKDRTADKEKEKQQNARIKQADERIAQQDIRDRASRMNMFTDNIRTDPELSDYIVIRDQATTAKDARAAKNSAGDIVLMRALARATDPRTGVREEEYRTFTGAQGDLIRLGVKFTQGMIGKGQLTEAGRDALLARIVALEKRKSVQAGKSLGRFRRQVLSFGDDPDLIIQQYIDEGGTEAPSPAAPATPGAPSANNDPMGIR